jgi:hypothetical protein
VLVERVVGWYLRADHPTTRTNSFGNRRR